MPVGINWRPTHFAVLYKRLINVNGHQQKWQLVNILSDAEVALFTPCIYLGLINILNDLFSGPEWSSLQLSKIGRKLLRQIISQIIVAKVTAETIPIISVLLLHSDTAERSHSSSFISRENISSKQNKNLNETLPMWALLKSTYSETTYIMVTCWRFCKYHPCTFPFNPRFDNWLIHHMRI